MQTQLTPYPELDVVLRDHAMRAAGLLGENFVGHYLQGSLAIGDFDLTSDIDFVVVTHEDLTSEEAATFERLHREICEQDTRWVRHLEYSLFPVPVLRDPTSPFSRDGRIEDLQRQLWYFDNGSRAIERKDHDNSLVVRWTLREHGVVVAGPHPATLLDPIASDALREEIRNTLVGWGRMLLEDPTPYFNRFYQSYLVLNYCRMLHDLREGKVQSKRAGAQWAKANLDPHWRDLIDFCWHEREDTSISVTQPADSGVFARSIDFVRYAVARAGLI